MKILLANGDALDTAKDLCAEERHVLQKALAWRDLATCIEQYREKVSTALDAGWNGQGPISPGPALSRLLSHIEGQVRRRLAGQVGGNA